MWSKFWNVFCVELNENGQNKADNLNKMHKIGSFKISCEPVCCVNPCQKWSGLSVKSAILRPTSPDCITFGLETVV